MENQVPLLERKKALLAGLESGGAPVAPEDCALMLVVELSSTPYQGNTVERERMREYLGNVEEVNTGPNTQVQVTVPWSGSGKPPAEGTELTAPALGMLLRGSKMRETFDAESGEWQYRRISGEGDALTLYYRHDGEEQCVRAARGTVTGTANSGTMPSVQITFTGLYERPKAVDVRTLTAKDWADEVPVNFQNTTVWRLHGFDCIGQNFSFDLANQVVYLNKPNYEGVHITDSKPTGQVSFQAPRIGVFDVFQKIESHKVVTTGPIEFEHGTEPGNIVGVRGPKVQLTGFSRQDSEGITHYQLDTKYQPDEGDDELVLYFK
ncbi:hypothetical protein ACGLWX_09670 [Halomonas sp. HMF6819]|uniref:hypothetical protein n=1 Tax=Halomonas sp. HMF6819 TaxID=3373085 RepID=UPI00379EB9AD